MKLEDVVVPDQIRTVIRTFREKLFTEIFTDRPARAKAMGLDEPWVPKTLIFAKDDSHAEDIVDIVRKEFGKGNDFCKKVTYRASGKSEDIIKAFRTAPEKRRRLVGVLDGMSKANAARRVSRRAEPANQFRIAVTVDMIATGTDITATRRSAISKRGATSQSPAASRDNPLEIVFPMRRAAPINFFEQMRGRGVRVVSETEIEQVNTGIKRRTGNLIVNKVTTRARSRSRFKFSCEPVRHN